LRWIILVLAVLIFFLVAVALAGAMLPPQHSVTRTIMLKQPPEAVWQAITDHGKEPEWRHDVVSVTKLADRNGHALVEEKYKNGDSMKIETVETQPPTRLVRDVVDNSMFTGRWTYTLTPIPEGTSISINETGSVPNPVFRFVSRFVIGHTTTVDRYLANLAARFGYTHILIGGSQK
jgi:uncharacterized protein YndB with AHSA1/START domain